MSEGQLREAGHEIQARSPADVFRFVVAAASLAIYLVVAWLFGDTVVGFTSDLLRGLDAMPDWLVRVIAVAIRVVVVVALVAGLALTIVRTGLRMLVTVGVAVIVAVGLALLLDDVPHVDEGGVPAHLDSGLGPLTDAGFPTAAGIAAVAAAVTAGAPWLSRRWRRWGWAAVAGLVVTRIAVSPLSLDSLKAVLIGWVVGSAVLVLLGAPSRRPTADAIAAGLATSGLPLESLKPASVDARGSTPYFGVGEDGTRYFVKALGTDQRSADLLFRLYRSAQRRDLGDERPFSSLRRAVEHEAFLALAARDLGIPTPRMRAFAVAEPNAYVLAYEAVDGRSLDGVPPEQITDDVLEEIWHQLARMRAVRLAHRDLRLANLFLGRDGKVWMIDFGFSELAASDLLLANDVAELVASSSAVVGPERATAHAIASVDAATLAAARDRLQPWSLSGASRTALKQQPGLLDDLRARLAPV
jgi:glycosyltransferase 2 family protein